MQLKTLLILACVAVFLLTAIPTSAAAAQASAPSVPTLSAAPRIEAPPNPEQAGGLPAGWNYWNQTIYWKNYSLQFYPGTRHFFPGQNIFDSLVVSNQIPNGQMTAYYVNASGHLLSYDIQTGVYTTLGAWPTNLSNYDSPAMVEGFQGWNNTLTALYEMGSNSKGYVDVEWYSIKNGTFYWANTTIFEGTSDTNVNLGVFNTTGWVFYTNNLESTIDVFNIFSHQLVTVSAPALPNWNSGIYVPGPEQVIEDVDQTSNNTLAVRAFNVTYAVGAGPTIHVITRWGGTISGTDLENMPYFFNISGTLTTLWGLGGGGNPNRNMVISLYKNMNLDGNPSTTNTGTLGTTDPSAYAYWDDSHYYFNGYNPNVGSVYQGPYIDPLNESGIFDTGASNSTWFNKFLNTYNFGFGGGPWVNTWQFIGTQQGWVNAIMDNGTSSATSCGTICTLMVYWPPSQTTEFANPPVPVGPVSGTPLSASSIQWSWSQSPSPGILNDTLYLYSGSTCSSLISKTSGGGAITTHTSTSLLGGTAYSYRVIAWNASGYSPFSNCATATTFSGTPAAPTLLSVTGETLTSLTFSWTNPVVSSSFNNISLAWGTSMGSLTTVVSEGKVTTATVSALSSATTYYAEVTAWNLTIPSVPSNEASAATLNGIPGKPIGLYVVTVTIISITLAWSLPSHGFNNVSMEYHLKHAGAANTTLTFGGLVSTITIGSLTPNTTYQFTVATWNGTVGSGYVPFINGTTAANSTGHGGGPGCGPACNPPQVLSVVFPPLFVIVMLALGVFLIVFGFIAIATQGRRWSPFMMLVGFILVGAAAYLW
jgi:Fibronectin type III domain